MLDFVEFRGQRGRVLIIKCLPCREDVIPNWSWLSSSQKRDKTWLSIFHRYIYTKFDTYINSALRLIEDSHSVANWSALLTNMSSLVQGASSDLQPTFGAMLIGGILWSSFYLLMRRLSPVFVATFLQGTLSIQAWNYYGYFPRDSIGLKSLVSG